MISFRISASAFCYATQGSSLGFETVLAIASHVLMQQASMDCSHPSPPAACVSYEWEFWETAVCSD